MASIWGRLGGLFAGIAMLSVPSMAQADALPCVTKVAAVYVHGAGYVYADFGGLGGMGVPLLCNLNGSIVGTNVGTITPDVCRGWLSVLMTAKSTQQNVALRIEYGAATLPASCTAVFPSWPSGALTTFVVPAMIALTN
jgi:hypothetical protein